MHFIPVKCGWIQWEPHSSTWRLTDLSRWCVLLVRRKQGKTDKAAGIWHWGVRYYASTDLYNWEDRGLLIPPVTDDPNSSLHPTSMMDRPHIIYNARTKNMSVG